MLPEQQQRILGYFIEEAKDHLNTIEQGLLNLQATLNDQEMINEVFRAAHSIKGGAAMLGLSSIQRTSHRLEDCFKVLKDNPIQVDQKLESLFLGVSDTLKVLLEHLSGPFGLSEDAANNLMSEAEPVFGWLHEHLELLVGQQGGGVVVVSTELEQVQQMPRQRHITVAHPLETADNLQYFQTQVLQKLRDMLQLFKQSATSESRQDLEACCEHLARTGEELRLVNWSNLCRATGSAIANPDNSYLMLAKIVITEIKQAQELAVAGRDAEIAVSQQLETLIGVPEIELFEFDDFLDEIAITENQDRYEVASRLENNFQTDDIAIDNFDDFIANKSFDAADDNVDSLFELSEQIEFGTQIHAFQKVEESDNIHSLLELQEQIDADIPFITLPAVKASNAANDNVSSLFELSEQIDDISAETLNNIILDPNGPSVGIAELSELDELFKVDAPELADTWEEENSDAIASEVNSEVINNEFENTDSQVEDLLEFEDSTSFHERQAINPQELTIVQLFGDFLDDFEVEPQKTPAKNLESTNGVVPISLAPQSQLEDINSTNTENLFTFDDDTSLISPLPIINLTTNLQPTSDNVAGLELSTHEDNHLDSLFLEAENSVDAISLVEESPSEMTIANPDLTFDSLLSSSDDTMSLPTNTDLDDLFDTPSTTPEFSQSSDDLSNFWMQEESEEQNIPLIKANNDIAQALEESLFAAASGNDIFDGDVNLSKSDDLELDDLDINFQPQEQIDSMFDLDDSNDLFEELTPAQIAAFSSVPSDAIEQVTHDNELQNYSQQLETPEFTPESSHPTLVNQTNNLPQLEVGVLSQVEVGNDLLDVPSNEMQASIADDALVERDANNPFAKDDLLIVETSSQYKAPETTSATGLDLIDDLFGENRVPFLESNIPGIDTDLPAVLADNPYGEQDAMPAESLNVLEPVTFEDTTVQSFDTEFNDNFFDDVLSIDEIESLNAILEPFVNVPISEIAEENTNLETTPTNDNDEADDEFAHLEALLNTTTVKSSNDLIADNEFAALEALLGDDDDMTPAQITSVVAMSTAYTAPAQTDEFGDLERLLMDADISLSPSGGSGAKNQRPVARRAARFEQLMKVPVKHLDDLSNLVGELVVNRNTLEQDQERLRQSLDNLLIQVHHLSDVGARMQELYERSLLEASLLASRRGGYGGGSNGGGGGYSGGSDSDRGFSELEMDRFTPFHSLSQEMIELIVRVRESASDIDFVTEETERVARQFRQVTTQLQEGLTRARMVPFSQVTDRVKRGVRDNAIKCGKQIELEIEGQDTLIDKMILEHLTDPLVHMLNNAIAHGIETPEERQTKGKKPVGTITVRAFHQGNQTVISVSDDGAGIDHERVKQKAIKVGLISPEQAKAMSRIELYELLFKPNFSTKDKADDLSGRGVGMDVVRTSISEIRGTITTDSKLGKGTNFTIRLPLTLSICKALCCVSDKARIAFPMDGVEDTLDIPAKNVLKGSEGQSVIAWRDTQLPFKPLKELLTLNRQLSRGSVYGGNRDDDMLSVVVVRSGNTLIALQVDQVLSEQEIVIKQFEGPAPKPIGVAGATVLGDGRIMPIADVLEILDIFQGRTSRQSPVTIFDTPNGIDNTAVKIDPTVLIVDDSITVRELLSLTFNKAGYRVEQARDGQEAWDKLRSGLPCDMVFCDIEMPRCDGLELLSRISRDPTLNHLPIAMLTSRGADKHKQMAINLGASGYFTKPYLEEALLEAAGRMLKGEKLISNTANA